jgi:hypothetical protein
MKTKKRRRLELVIRFNGWRVICAGLTHGDVLAAFVKSWDMEIL